ncbi:MAG: hypothetical protein QOD86_646 [Miltoncostaeaceae bacterium]|nr:hypothetical protein [Miltoncostaeaceae bacterium]
MSLTDGRTFSVPVSGTGVSPPGPTPTAPEAGATAKPPTVRARCAIRRVRGWATVTCRTTFAAKPGLKVAAIRLVRGGKVYAKADIRRAGRVTLRLVRPLPRGRFTVVTTARLSKAKQTRQPLTV